MQLHMTITQMCSQLIALNPGWQHGASCVAEVPDRVFHILVPQLAALM
jgi:hypothetical protein